MENKGKRNQVIASNLYPQERQLPRNKHQSNSTTTGRICKVPRYCPRTVQPVASSYTGSAIAGQGHQLTVMLRHNCSFLYCSCAMTLLLQVVCLVQLTKQYNFRVCVFLFSEFLELAQLIKPLTLNDTYRGRTAPLTSKVAFYIFIQQVQVLNILNMVYTLRFFLFKTQFVSQL